ncbi:hypothetical protein GIB67_003183 [Kingdonia uniflora]|uniref:Uncharacterized protein n=1 Tax=Kingdonia uniflora TaxID=39325 RepID=A0A7J7N677_9MAGN|nr:hypothetical protein GIB67_003183 [Kingdonia uniflora]
MNGVQLYTIVHFGGDIIRPKIGSIATYVGGSTKLTSLRAHSSYKDFVILLEEISKIHREDCKLYNFVHGCACAISSVQDFTVMINMHKTDPNAPFHIWIVNELRVPSQNSHNFISDFCSSGKGLSTTKDISSRRGLSTTKVGGPLRHNSFPDPEPEYRGYPETNGRGLDPRRFGPFVDDENDSLKTIRTDVPPSNEHSIPQSIVHISNEPVLTNIPQSNEPFQTIPTNVLLSNEPSIPQSSIHLSNEHALTNVHPSNEPMLTNIPFSIEPETIIGEAEPSDARQLSARIPTTYELLYGNESYDLIYHRYGVAYTNHVKSWNNVILKVRDLPIYVFIEEFYRIYSKMSYTYWEEAEKIKARLTPWATDHCESRKWYLLCRWWKAMGIPCEHGVRALGHANVDPTTRVSEYYTNNTYKAVYEPIWIPISGIEQWKILKTDPCVRAPIPSSSRSSSHAKEEKGKNSWSCDQTKILQ